MQVQLLTPKHQATAENVKGVKPICSLKGKHMTDDRVWEFEESLWTGTAEHYREIVDADCLMVLPEPPFVLVGEQAIAAVSDTPRWARVTT